MASTSWQRNLAANFAAEFLAMMAFTFIDPLLPLYIQKVGDLTTKEAAFWSGMASSGLSVAMFLISPVWGLLADRFGRKPMVMRVMFGGAVVLSLMSFAPNIYLIIFLRWCQGLVTGSIPAMTALASSTVPRNRMSFAMGIIMLAVFGGQSLGPLIGGFVADHLGYQVTFYMSGALLVLSGIIVLLMVKEHFERPSQGQGTSLRSMLRLAKSRQMLIVFVILFLLNMGQSFVSPIISLRIKELDPAGRAATAAGLTFSLMGLAAAISSLASGRLGERISLPRIMVFSCFIIGLLYLPPIWAGSVGLLAAFLALTGLLRGGLATSSNAIVGLSAAQDQQGIAFGLSQSASSLGGGIGPLIGGSLATVVGLRPIFAVAAGVYMLAGLFAARWLLPRIPVKH
ncbi:MAG: MFS transporter [Chloroflexi bacterium]|nr:MFS transporter [Chloroflexota bacterium]